jgi:16S rRNA (guanine527-N7)-methyltransferase
MPPRGIVEKISAASGRDVSRETVDQLERYVDCLSSGAAEQNLIAPSTHAHIWERHVLDSAQLVRFEPFRAASWVDIGSGAGLPGLVVALLVEGPVTLVEPRRLRAEFLQRTAASLDLSSRVRVESNRVERVSGTFDVICARAVAPLARLLEISQHLSTTKTVWALPKGRSALTELVEVQRAWQGAFHVEKSVTDIGSYIVVGTGVGKKRC